MLKVSAFYLEKQKSFPQKKYFLGRSQYQNKKALFTDPIFNEGFGFRHQFLSVCSTLQEHALKMCLGPTSSITATFDDYQVIHCYHSSLILTIIASNEALTGKDVFKTCIGM